MPATHPMEFIYLQWEELFIMFSEKNRIVINENFVMTVAHLRPLILTLTTEGDKTNFLEE